MQVHFREENFTFISLIKGFPSPEHCSQTTKISLRASIAIKNPARFNLLRGKVKFIVLMLKSSNMSPQLSIENKKMQNTRDEFNARGMHCSEIKSEYLLTLLAQLSSKKKNSSWWWWNQGWWPQINHLSFQFHYHNMVSLPSPKKETHKPGERDGERGDNNSKQLLPCCRCTAKKCASCNNIRNCIIYRTGREFEKRASEVQ